MDESAQFGNHYEKIDGSIKKENRVRKFRMWIEKKTCLLSKRAKNL